MKKLIAILCMTACLFGLTACGGGETLTEYEQKKVEYAQSLATDMFVPLLSQYMDDEQAASFDDYTAEEVEYIVSNQYNASVDGVAFVKAIDSFHAAGASVGSVTGTGESTARIDGSQIIVEVEVNGEKKNANAELIFSNDMFMKMESAALNPKATVGELMTNAALNTLIGMGTVFAVLILISLLISCFKVIPKIQANMARKKKAAQDAASVENAAPSIAEPEIVEADETDDCELVAVIAAAIAASEGAVTTDGFVVRSIRRR